MNAINVAIFDDCGRQLGKLVRLASSGLGCVSEQALCDLFAELGSHGTFENTGCDCSHSDSVSSQVTRHGHDHAVDGTFTGGVGDLATLAFLSGDTAHKEDQTPLSAVIDRSVLGHHDGGVLCDVDRAHDIDADNGIESLEVEGAL